MMGDNRRMIFDDVGKLRDTVLLRMGELQLTYEKLADRAGISPESVRNIVTGTVKKPTIDTFLKIMNALEFDIWLEARLN